MPSNPPGPSARKIIGHNVNLVEFIFYLRKDRSAPRRSSSEQWTGRNSRKLRAFVGPDLHKVSATTYHLKTDSGATFPLVVGDWIIKCIEGGFTFCPPDIFETTYEAVTE